MDKVKELRMKYFVLKLSEDIDLVKLKDKLLDYVIENNTTELRGDKLALMIVNSIIEED